MIAGHEVKMVWFDMETTGLDAATEVPLEVGMIMTDKVGNELDAVSFLVWEPDDLHYIDAWDKAIPLVKDMHAKSGLDHDLESKPCWTRNAADMALVATLAAVGVERGTLPMCGNSIGSLDRPFALVHFPLLNKYLHYRNIDLSSDKELMKMHRPDLYEKLKPIIGTKENATHRVLDDCRASIREYQVYLEHWYKV